MAKEKSGETGTNILGENLQSKAILAVLIAVVLIAFVFFYVQSQKTQTQEILRPAEQITTDKQIATNEERATNNVQRVIYTYPPSNHFGFVNAKQDYSAISGLGVTWDRPYPGPFNWEKIGYAKYNWGAADAYVKSAQEHGLNTLGIIWPYNQLDQEACHKTETDIEFGELAGDLATKRRKPCDMNLYSEFVKALVERYDADSVNDMPGLKYGIKYWEAMSEPELQQRELGKVFFQGDAKDYVEILKATSNAVKTADPDAKILNGGISKDGIGSTFWTEVFFYAKNYFDIANYHCADCDDAARIQEFKNFLGRNGITKPIWITSITFTGDSDKEQAQKFFKGYLNAFGKGADKIFYERWNEALGGKAALANIIQLPDVKKQAYNTLIALIKKPDNFSSAREVSDGYYEFTINGKKVYAFMKVYDLPAEIAGQVTKMDFNGTEKKETMYNVVSADIPTVIEKA